MSIADFITVVSFGITCFCAGYTFGKDNNKTGVLPVKRTMKNNNFFSVSLLTDWRYFYAAFNVSS